MMSFVNPFKELTNCIENIFAGFTVVKQLVNTCIYRVDYMIYG